MLKLLSAELPRFSNIILSAKGREREAEQAPLNPVTSALCHAFTNTELKAVKSFSL